MSPLCATGWLVFDPTSAIPRIAPDAGSKAETEPSSATANRRPASYVTPDSRPSPPIASGPHTTFPVARPSAYRYDPISSENAVVTYTRSPTISGYDEVEAPSSAASTVHAR